MTDAQQLDPQSAAVLARLDGPGVPQCAAMTPAEARQWMGGFMADMALDPPPEVGAIKKLSADGPDRKIPVRLYRPKDAGSDPLPIMVFFHAGGYVFGDLDGLDSFCRLITAEAGCLVASVDYRPKASSRPPTRTPTPPRAGSPPTPLSSAPIPTASPSPATRPAARWRSRCRRWRWSAAGP